MREAFWALVPYLLLIAVIAGGFKIYKNYGTIVGIESTDKSMDTNEVPAQHYTCDTRAACARDLAAGDVVAYWLPNEPGKYRIARVKAIEGQLIEADGKTLSVNGKPETLHMDRSDWHLPAVRVPKDCVLLMTDNPSDSQDSARIGPVPFYQIIGKLRL